MFKQVVKWMFCAAAMCGALSWVTAGPALAAPGDQSFVYTNANTFEAENFVEGFSRDKRTGRLTYIGRFETGGIGDAFIGGFQQHSIISDGEFVYTVNPGDDTISSFSVGKNGRLTLLNVVPSGGRRPVALALHQDLLYVANAGDVAGTGEGLDASYSGFHVRRDGSLAPIPGSTVVVPPVEIPEVGTLGVSLGDVLISQDGKKLFGTQLVGNAIDSFTIGKNGLLSNHQVTPGSGGPFGAAFSPAHKDQLFVTNAIPEIFGPPAPGVSSYDIGKRGALDLIQDLTIEESVDPCWIVFSKDGRYCWLNTFIPRELFLVQVRPNGRMRLAGSLVGVDDADVPADVVVGGTDIAASPDGRFLYMLRAFSVPDAAVPVTPRIQVYRITGDYEEDAGLRHVQSALLPDDTSETGIMGLVVVDRNGRTSD